MADQGINGFRMSVEARKACCGVRKVEPLGRALAGAAAWITGLRADQSAARSSIALPRSMPAIACSRSIRCLTRRARRWRH